MKYQLFVTMDKIFKKIAILFCLLGTVSAIAVMVVDTKKCPKRNGVFPKLGTSCRSYYRCRNWNPVEETCPQGWHFNPARGWCDWHELYPCLEKPSRKECPRPNGKFLKTGTNCRVFYACCNGEPTEKRCPAYQLFDPSAEKCEWPELYKCVEKPRRKECPRPNGKFLKTGTNCKVFYDCCNGEPTEKRCPADQLFDPSAEKCEWPELYKCVESITTIVTISSTEHPSTTAEIESTKDVVVQESTTISKLLRISTTPISTTGETDTNDIVVSESTVITTPHRTSTTQVPSTASGSDLNTYSETITESVPPITTAEAHTETSSILVSTSQVISTTRPATTKSTIDYISTSTDMFSTSSHSSVITDATEYQSTPSTRLPTTQKWPKVTASPTFPPTTRDTERSTVTKTISVIVGTSPNIMCPEPDGYFPHPTDKHKFVGCVDGIPSVLTCPSRLVYDQERRACAYE